MCIVQYYIFKQMKSVLFLKTIWDFNYISFSLDVSGKCVKYWVKKSFFFCKNVRIMGALLNTTFVFYEQLKIAQKIQTDLRFTNKNVKTNIGKGF